MMDITTLQTMYPMQIMATLVIMDAAQGSQLWEMITETGPIVLTQWIGVIVAILGIGWGFKEKRRGNKLGVQEIAKNAYEQMVIENNLLIKKAQSLRKDSDKWLLARAMILKLDDGIAIIKKIEEAADDISSDEP